MDRSAACVRSVLQQLDQALRKWATCSEEVFAEAVEELVVYGERLAIRLRYLPSVFRIWCSTGGAGASYTAVIERWEVL